jgi:hypothetical protein
LESLNFSNANAERITSDLLEGDLDSLGEFLGVKLKQDPNAPRL